MNRVTLERDPDVRDEPTSDVYHGRETKAARTLPKELWPVIRRKLDAIHQARSLQDLRLPQEIDSKR